MKIYLLNGFLAFEAAPGQIKFFSRNSGGVFSIQQDGDFITMFIIGGPSGENEKILAATNYADIEDEDGNPAGGDVETVVAYIQDLTIET